MGILRYFNAEGGTDGGRVWTVLLLFHSLCHSKSRELVYNLDKPELRDEEKIVEEMTDKMEDVKVALIGGQDACAEHKSGH